MSTLVYGFFGALALLGLVMIFLPLLRRWWRMLTRRRRAEPPAPTRRNQP